MKHNGAHTDSSDKPVHIYKSDLGFWTFSERKVTSDRDRAIEFVKRQNSLCYPWCWPTIWPEPEPRHLIRRSS